MGRGSNVPGGKQPSHCDTTQSFNSIYVTGTVTVPITLGHKVDKSNPPSKPERRNRYRGSSSLDGLFHVLLLLKRSQTSLFGFKKSTTYAQATYKKKSQKYLKNSDSDYRFDSSYKTVVIRRI